MKARTRALNQLDCGCYRYCDDCVDGRPAGFKDLEFSRSLSEMFGEAWGDQGHWEATEFSSSFPVRATSELPRQQRRLH